MDDASVSFVRCEWVLCFRILWVMFNSNQINLYLYRPNSQVTVCLGGLCNLYSQHPLALDPQLEGRKTCPHTWKPFYREKRWKKAQEKKGFLSQGRQTNNDAACTEQINNTIITCCRALAMFSVRMMRKTMSLAPEFSCFVVRENHDPKTVHMLHLISTDADRRACYRILL